MSIFGQTLFGGSRFIRWALTPLVLIFALVMPLFIEEWTLVRVLLIAGMELVCIALLAGFWLPARFDRAGGHPILPLSREKTKKILPFIKQ